MPVPNIDRVCIIDPDSMEPVIPNIGFEKDRRLRAVWKVVNGLDVGKIQWGPKSIVMLNQQPDGKYQMMVCVGIDRKAKTCEAGIFLPTGARSRKEAVEAATLIAFVGACHW